MLDAEEMLARAPHAGLHLVRDEEPARLLDVLIYPREVLRPRVDDAAKSRDGLGDIGRDLARGGILDNVFHFVGAHARVLLRRQSLRPPVGVIGRGVVDAENVGRRMPPDGLPRHGHSHEGAPMKGVAQGDELMPLGVVLGDDGRQLVGLAAGVGEKANFQRRVGRLDALDQLLGHFHDLGVKVERRRVIKSLHLGLSLLDQLRMAMPHRNRHHPRESVEIFFVLLVIDILHGRPPDQKRLAMIRHGGRQQQPLPHLQNLLRSPRIRLIYFRFLNNRGHIESSLLVVSGQVIE